MGDIRFMAWSAAAMVALSGCEKSSGDGRYELSKDGSGNIVRLDRRTGDIAIIKGDTVVGLKDAAKAAELEKTKHAEIAQLRNWPSVDVETIGLRGDFASAWRDGKMYYKLELSDLSESKAIDEWLRAPKDKKPPASNPEKRSASLRTAVGTHRPFTIELTDKDGFTLATLNASQLTNIVDDNGKSLTFEEKNSIPMAAGEYERIKQWTMQWRNR